MEQETVKILRAGDVAQLLECVSGVLQALGVVSSTALIDCWCRPAVPVLGRRRKGRSEVQGHA